MVPSIVSASPTAKVVLDHIIRESEYFVDIAKALLYPTLTVRKGPIRVSALRKLNRAPCD